MPFPAPAKLQTAYAGLLSAAIDRFKLKKGTHIWVSVHYGNYKYTVEFNKE